MSGSQWIICQIGAREHYAIPRALQQTGQLAELVTDFWVPPGHPFCTLPGAKRLRDRFHPELADASVWAPNLKMLTFETAQRLRKRSGWAVTFQRNELFQQAVIQHLKGLKPSGQITLFSYSYAARELFRFAKSKGWRTVLGQIDPGPEEERIVQQEHRRYASLQSAWQPVPAYYWTEWKEEVALADSVIVNSEWSRQCLAVEGVPEAKIEVVPLVYGPAAEVAASPASSGSDFKVLFLGQVNLRKGIGRLLDTMRLLRDEPYELILAGPTEIDPAMWRDLPKVKYVGSVPRSEVGDYYRSADAFILPTLSDGYALTQLEAMANGLPVIASKHCGQAVQPGVNGWLLEDLEPATIAATLRQASASRAALTGIRPPSFSLDDLAARLNGS